MSDKNNENKNENTLPLEPLKVSDSLASRALKHSINNASEKSLQRSNTRQEHNKELIKRMRAGDSLQTFDSVSSWFPPRPIIGKDQNALLRLYGQKTQKNAKSTPQVGENFSKGFSENFSEAGLILFPRMHNIVEKSSTDGDKGDQE